MVLKQEVLAEVLEGIIDRLDEARSSALLSGGSVDFESVELDPDISDDTDTIEAAVLEYESRMDELTQVLGEEIDNLRRLLENLEEDL
jgi:hypothetical protein